MGTSPFRYRRVSPRKEAVTRLDDPLNWDVIERAQLSDGSELVLVHRDDEWIVRIDARVLMSNKVHNSEEVLAQHGVARVADVRSVLVGGLGLGYTLRATLDAVTARATVTVAELVPELVDWNRTHLGALNGHPLDDPRCKVAVGDVFELLDRSPSAFDVILLDVDNGPQALARPKNQRLYGRGGVRACHAALRPGGVLAVWSRGPSIRYVRQLASHFHVEVQRIAAKIGSGSHHVVFIATPHDNVARA